MTDPLLPPPAVSRPAAVGLPDADTVADWFRANSRRIGIAGLSLLVAAGAVWAYSYSRDQASVQAEASLASARRNVYAGNAPLAQADLRKVVQRHGSTSAGVQARMQLAQLMFEDGKVPEGIAELTAARDLRAGKQFRASIEGLIAAGEEQRSAWAPAAEAYRRAAAAAATDMEREAFRADEARALMNGNDRAGAAKAWQALLKSENEGIAAEAAVRLGELTAKPAAGK